MARQGAYGAELGDRFRLETPALVSRAIRKAEIAVTRLQCPAENHGMTAPFEREDAFLVGLQLSGVPDHELWFDGRPLPKRPFAPGVTSFYDLKRDPIAYLRSPFHSLMFYLPRRALNSIADNEGTARIDDLDYTPGLGVDDAVIRGLGLALWSAFDHCDDVSQLFVDHVTLAVGAHVAQTYGGLRLTLRPVRGGLAPWQEHRAKEMLAAQLDGATTVAQLAQACGLSPSHFARAFRQSTGLAPHQWLVRLRIQAAKAKLRNRLLPLSEVAILCGFSDQSHFTRVFSREVGVSPGAWRRSLAE